MIQYRSICELLYGAIWKFGLAVKPLLTRYYNAVKDNDDIAIDVEVPYLTIWLFDIGTYINFNKVYECNNKFILVTHLFAFGIFNHLNFSFNGNVLLVPVSTELSNFVLNFESIVLMMCHFVTASNLFIEFHFISLTENVWVIVIKWLFTFDSVQEFRAKRNEQNTVTMCRMIKLMSFLISIDGAVSRSKNYCQS